MAWAWVTSPTTAALDARRTPYRTGRLRPRARAASAGPHRRQGSAADYQSATARAGAPAPPGGVSARDGAASSLASSHCGGPAWVCCRRGGSRAYRLRPGAAVREPSPCSAGARSSRPAFRRLSGWRPWQDVPAVLNQARPSMYEMEGPCPASPRRQASCWSSPHAARRGQVPAQGASLPAPRVFPASPRVVPVSSGESIITTAASIAQGSEDSHSCFPLSTKESTESRQSCAFHRGYPRVYSQGACRLPV